MSKAPTREECEALFELLRAAWESGNVTALRDRTMSGAVDLAMLELVVGRPVSFEGSEAVDARTALIGARTTLGGVIAIEAFRDRAGVARLELGALVGDARDREGTFSGLIEQARRMAVFRSAPKRAKSPAPKRRWRVPPQAPALREIPYLGLDRPKVSAEEIASLERTVGTALPPGYVEYVTRFGEACDSTFLRVYPPERVLGERAAWQTRIDRYWFWRASDDGFDQDAAYDSYVLADTLSGDEILWHPRRPDSFYVLPRELEEVIPRTMPFEALLAWAASSGDLDGRAEFRFVVPLRDRVQVDFDYEDVDVDAVLRTLTSLGSGAVSAQDDEGVHVLWTAHGLEVFASDEPYLGLTHEPSTDPAFADRVIRALAPFGAVRTTRRRASNR